MAEVSYQELYKKTNELIPSSSIAGRGLKGLLYPSLSSYFSVYIVDDPSNSKAKDISILAYEAVLPGTSFELGQVFGDREGVTEQYPTRRVFPPVDVSFYVNHDYETIKYFEKWVNSISTITDQKVSNASYKFKYPSTYEKEVIITKYEREFFNETDRLKNNITAREPKMILKYHLVNAFPSNIISLPVSYSDPDVLKTTITFNYDRYWIEDSSKQAINT